MPMPSQGHVRRKISGEDIGDCGPRISLRYFPTVPRRILENKCVNARHGGIQRLDYTDVIVKVVGCRLVELLGNIRYGSLYIGNCLPNLLNSFLIVSRSYREFYFLCDLFMVLYEIWIHQAVNDSTSRSHQP